MNIGIAMQLINGFLKKSVVMLVFGPSMQQKQWVCVAVLALLLVTDALAEVGKAEKQGK